MKFDRNRCIVESREQPLKCNSLEMRLQFRTAIQLANFILHDELNKFKCHIAGLQTCHKDVWLPRFAILYLVVNAP